MNIRTLRVDKVHVFGDKLKNTYQSARAETEIEWMWNI